MISACRNLMRFALPVPQTDSLYKLLALRVNTTSSVSWWKIQNPKKAKPPASHAQVRGLHLGTVSKYLRDLRIKPLKEVSPMIF